MKSLLPFAGVKISMQTYHNLACQIKKKLSIRKSSYLNGSIIKTGGICVNIFRLFKVFHNKQIQLFFSMFNLFSAGPIGKLRLFVDFACLTSLEKKKKSVKTTDSIELVLWSIVKDDQIYIYFLIFQAKIV